MIDLEKILEQEIRLELGAGGDPAERDLKVATTVMLVFVAQADDHLDGSEIELISAALTKHFGTTDADNGHLIQVADFLRRDSGKLELFAGMVRDGFTAEQRIKLTALMWKVMEADGLIQEAEEAVLARATQSLGLSDEEVEQAIELSRSAPL